MRPCLSGQTLPEGAMGYHNAMVGLRAKEDREVREKSHLENIERMEGVKGIL